MMLAASVRVTTANYISFVDDDRDPFWHDLVSVRLQTAALKERGIAVVLPLEGDLVVVESGQTAV